MYKRWYDQEPNCTKLMIHIHGIQQVEVQEFCGRLLAHFAEQMRKQVQYKNNSGLTSIGVPGIEQLYKFKQQQRRWYDKVRSVQKAVGTMYTLPPEGLIALGFTAGDMFGLIAVYAHICAEIDHPPLISDLVSISKKALQEGTKEAMHFIKTMVGEDLFALIYSKQGLPEHTRALMSDEFLDSYAHEPLSWLPSETTDA